MTGHKKRAIRLLLVDDDTATRDGYTSYLAGAGYDVLSAATGHEALITAATSVLDVIVLDLALPDVDGWEVARQLKAAPGTATIPIIALTGANLPHERVSAMRAGCDRYVVKPCEPSDLAAMIQRCVAETA